MYSIWLYLKENCNCSCKMTDIHQLAARKLVWNKEKKNKVEREKNNNGREFLPIRRAWLVKSISFRPSYTQEQFYQLNAGDPSRNVIERIFERATTTKHAGRIERVLRVRNSAETIKRFEEYREMVKKRANCNSFMYHPRSVVDGNELLRFYSTTMSCCSRKQNRVSEPCHNPKCCLCRMIQTGFDTDDTRKTGIQLNADIEITLNNSMISVAKGENVKRAVVICRVIAGRVVNTVEVGSDEGFDSVSNGGLCTKLEQLFVRNPEAVLPCFVIVCS